MVPNKDGGAPNLRASCKSPDRGERETETGERENLIDWADSPNLLYTQLLDPLPVGGSNIKHNRKKILQGMRTITHLCRVRM